MKIAEFEDYPGYYRSVVMGDDFVIFKDGYDFVKFSFEEFEEIIKLFKGNNDKN